MELDELRTQIEAEKNLMVSVATGGPRIQEVNQAYIQRRTRIGDALREMGIPDPNPYDDLWAWYGKWSSDLQGYQSRREYLSQLFAPVLLAILRRREGKAYEPPAQPTGWTRVDRNLDQVRLRLDQAKVEEEFQAVGLMCRETLISLGQAVYVQGRHVPSDGVTPSETDAYRMIEAFFSAELGGGSNEVIRSHAKSALKLALELQHRRTAARRDAQLCAEATRTVVNLVAIISARAG